MGLKLYLDENIPPQIARELRARGHDVLSAHEVGMEGKNDDEQLTYASGARRTLLTFDVRFAPLATRWLHKGEHHSGIVISKELKGGQTGELIRLCLVFLDQITEEQAADVLMYLQQFKPKP